MVNVGIIKCKNVDSHNGLCPGRSCFSSAKLKKGKFETYEDKVEITAFGHCGGCPGRNVSKVAKIMKEECGVEVVHLSSCSFFTSPACPFLKGMEEAIKSRTGLPVVVGTHPRGMCKSSGGDAKNV